MSVEGTTCKRCGAEYDPEMGCYCNVIEFPKNVEEVKSGRPQATGVFPGTGIPIFPAKRATTMHLGPDAHLGAVCD